jgi:hypothetical protein
MSPGRSHERLRGWLVISEVALACVLLVSAGLLLRSFLNVFDVDLGFEPERASGELRPRTRFRRSRAARTTMRRPI